MNVKKGLDAVVDESQIKSLEEAKGRFFSESVMQFSHCIAQKINVPKTILNKRF